MMSGLNVISLFSGAGGLDLGFEKAGTVTGSITGLAKKGLVDKFTETVEIEGKPKEVKYFQLNEAGREYDPDAVTQE